jgi:hypothetical protein
MKSDIFDMTILLQSIKEDIKKQKYMILWSGFVSLVISFILFPMAILFFFLMFRQADLPIFDHDLEYIFRDTNSFLIPYDIMLVYYFAVMYFKNSSLHKINFKHYKKALIFSALSFIISLIAIKLGESRAIVIVYFGFFIASIYFLSYTYYDIALKDAFDNLKNPLYRDDDLGWSTPMGVLDNPFSFQDDINRARLFVQTSTIGFDIVVLFINQTVNSIIFWYALGDSRYIKESARVFDLILENRLQGAYDGFSYPSVNILRVLNYLSLNGKSLRLPKRGKQVAKKALKIDSKLVDI